MDHIIKDLNEIIDRITNIANQDDQPDKFELGIVVGGLTKIVKQLHDRENPFEGILIEEKLNHGKKTTT